MMREVLQGLTNQAGLKCGRGLQSNYLILYHIFSFCLKNRANIRRDPELPFFGSQEEINRIVADGALKSDDFCAGGIIDNLAITTIIPNLAAQIRKTIRKCRILMYGRSVQYTTT